MASGAESQTPSLKRLREAVAEIMGIPAAAIAEDADLMRLGLDSIGTLRLVSRLRRDGIAVSARDLTVEPTLAALARRVDGDLAQPTLDG